MSKHPWFQDRGIGQLFPLPVTVAGWLSLLALVLLMLGTAWLPHDLAIGARFALVAAWLLLAYFRTERL